MIYLYLYPVVGLVVAGLMWALIPIPDKGSILQQIWGVFFLTTIWPVIVCVLIIGLWFEVQFRYSHRQILKKRPKN